MSNEYKTVQDCRIAIANQSRAITAKAELGKLGFVIEPEKNDGTTQSQMRLRADCRRAMNAVMETVDKKQPGPHNESKLETVEWLAAVINMVSIELDLAGAEGVGATIAAGARAGRGTPLNDVNGNRIGTMLPNAVLRDEDAIRNSIGTGRWDGEGGMTLTDFVRGVANMRTTEPVRNALTVGTDTAGGYTVPTVLMPGIMSALVPSSALLSAGANVALLTDGAKSFTIPGIGTVPTASWRAEGGSLATSDPVFRQITVTPQSLAFMFKVSRELLADSPNLEQALRIAVAQSFGVALDLAGLRGSGTAPEIRGLRNVSGVNITSMGTNGATPTNFSQLVAGWKAIATANAPLPTSEIMHPRDLATYANLLDTTNQPLRRPELIANMRQFATSQIPTNIVQGTSGAVCSEIYQGDFSLMTWYFREQVSMQLLSELYAGTGEVAFACHVRADVAVIYPQAFNVITGVKP